MSLTTRGKGREIVLALANQNPELTSLNGMKTSFVLIILSVFLCCVVVSAS